MYWNTKGMVHREISNKDVTSRKHCHCRFLKQVWTFSCEKLVNVKYVICETMEGVFIREDYLRQWCVEAAPNGSFTCRKNARTCLPLGDGTRIDISTQKGLWDTLKRKLWLSSVHLRSPVANCRQIGVLPHQSCNTFRSEERDGPQRPPALRKIAFTVNLYVTSWMKHICTRTDDKNNKNTNICNGAYTISSSAN